jgi:hypothetical protein
MGGKKLLAKVLTEGPGLEQAAELEEGKDPRAVARQDSAKSRVRSGRGCDPKCMDGRPRGTRRHRRGGKPMHVRQTSNGIMLLGLLALQVASESDHD